MSQLLRHHRKGLASAALGLWLFALFLGIAHACSWDGVTTVTHTPAPEAHVGGGVADDRAPNCEDSASNDLPLPSGFQLVQDPPAEVAMIVATQHDLRLLPNSAPLAGVSGREHPPPGVPFFHRIVRLTL
jgi:hypothetical protein